MRTIPLSQAIALREASAEFLRKAEICARVLAEARKLCRAGRIGALGKQLLVRAGELLDDMDEIRASLDPVLNRSSFLATDALHRELARIRAGASSARRRSAPFEPPA